MAQYHLYALFFSFPPQSLSGLFVCFYFWEFSFFFNDFQALRLAGREKRTGMCVVYQMTWNFLEGLTIRVANKSLAVVVRKIKKKGK
jgi:hypothetical protein